MSNLDDQIRDALTQRAGDVAAPAGARAAIERGVVRARRRRAIGGGVLAVALLVGGGVMTSSLLREDKPGGFVQPGGDPIPPESAISSSGVTAEARFVYSDPRGFEITYPEDYERSYFEGDVVIQPPGLPSLEQGEPTFGISFQIAAGANEPMDCQGPDLAQPGRSGYRYVDGQSVVTCDQTGDDGDNWYRRTYSYVWKDQTCDHISMGCRSDTGVTLTVRMVGATKALWERYLEDGTAIAESARPTPPRPNEDAMEAASHGETAEEPATAAAIANANEVFASFMDARIAGSGAEAYMTDQAKASSSAELYGHGSAGIDYVRWTQDSTAPVDANSFVFDVRVTSADGAVSREQVGVGSDEGSMKVRYIQLVSRETS